MRLDSQKLFAITVAGFCGITGFVIAFWLIGLLFEPIITFFKSKK